MQRRNRAPLAVALLGLAFATTGADRAGCDKPQARVHRIQGDAMPLVGPQALGTEGDYVLFNDQAAFIVTAPGERLTTWWYYPGILVDAVALDGCASGATTIDQCNQAGLERYEEFLPLVVQADLASIPDNGLGALSIRGFRGDSVEVVNDGSDGRDAILRVHGADDRFWLVELTLVLTSFSLGSPIPLSDPFGLEMEVDYVLPAGGAALEVVVRYRNTKDEEQKVIPAAAHLFGTTLKPESFQLTEIPIEGFEAGIGMPWVIGHSVEDDGAVAFGIEKGILSGFGVSGVDAFSDARRALLPYRLAPAGSDGDSAETHYFFGVGADGPAAERALQAARPRAFPTTPYTLASLPGRIVQKSNNAPIPGATVRVEARVFGDGWQTLHRTTSGSDGRFELAVADLKRKDLEMRLRVEAEGRAASAPLPFSLDAIPNPTIELGRRGEVAYDVRDDEGRAMPARITLWDGGREVSTTYATGVGSIFVTPGDYGVSVTRGYEYETFQDSLAVSGTEATTLQVTLSRLVNTDGWMSMDGHLHAAPSPDSRVTIADRIRTAAAGGLEVPISTDHEYVSSWQVGIDEAGLGDWITTVVGLELTASVPEHINIYGLEPRFDIDGRGGIVRWYGLDAGQIYAAARARGAGVVGLNHPNYLDVIGYDPLTGLPDLTDPTEIGLPADAEIWSWDLDMIELKSAPFGSNSGSFENWMSFFNHGHPVTAVTNTDSHGLSRPGGERNYFVSPTDGPADLDPADLVRAIDEGRSFMSRGAFARISTVDGSGLGDTVRAVGGNVDLSIQVQAIPEIDVSHVIVFVNCDEALKIPTTDPDGLIKLNTTVSVPVSEDASIVVAGFGTERLPRGLASFSAGGSPRFMTNPILADRDGNGAFDAPGGKTCSYNLSAP